MSHDNLLTMGRGGILSTMIIPVALSFVPGWGHIYLHRKQVGLMLFMLFFSALNAALVLEPFFEGRWVDPAAKISLAAAAATFIFSVVDIARCAVWSRRASAQRRRRRYLRRAIQHLVRNEHGQSYENLSKMLRINPTDPVAWVYLAMSQESAGEWKRARTSWKRARDVDRHRNWSDEVVRGMARSLKEQRR